MRVQLEHVSKHYMTGAQRQTVLNDVSAEFAAGRFVVLVGRSGSGKSTLLNLIAGFDAPDGGTVSINDQPISAGDDQARTLFRRRHLGFVFQFFNLLPTLSVAENVRLPLELLDESGQDERVAAALDEVGMAAFGERFPEELSGGEQQRVAIARALVHEPAIVLADEPTGNLDLNTAGQVIQLLDDACRRHGTTLIMATHSTEVIGVADEVYELRDGRLESS